MNKCVHTEHCCDYHGCKYGDEDCPVWLGLKKQSFPCESCAFFDDFKTLDDKPEVLQSEFKKRQLMLDIEDWS